MKKNTFIVSAIILVITVLVTFLYHTTQQADINYYQAQRYFKHGNYQDAIPYYKESLRINPTKLDAIKELAYSYLWTDKTEKSIPLFKQAIEKKPDDYNIMLSLADAYSWKGDYESAILVLRNILDKKNNLQAKINLAEIHIWNEEPEKALTILENILNQDPEHTKANILFARSLYYTDKIQEASEAFEKLLALDDEQIKELLAEVYIADEKHDEAIELYREIVNKNPLNLKARQHLADLLSWSGQYDESISEYKSILKLNPKDLETMINLAQVYMWKGDFKEAELIYKDILKIYPENTEVYVLIGEILSWQNKYEEAITYFEKASRITEKPNLSYGMTLLYLGRYNQAKTVFNKILEKDPENLEAKIMLADCYAYTQMHENAITIYNKVLDVEPLIEVKEKLANTLSWNKQYDIAVKLYDEILDEKYSQRVHRQKARVLGWAKRYKESYEEYQKILDKEFDENINFEMRAKKAYYNRKNRTAIKKYRQLICKEPDNIEAMFDLGQIYSYKFMWNKAKRVYENILHIHPEHQMARDALYKSKLVSEYILFDTRYDFFKGKSSNRDTDIKKHQVLNSLSIPLNDETILGIDYFFINRKFKDFDRINENQVRIKLSYLKRPDWQGGIYYGLSDYSKALNKTQHFFGGNLSIFLDDIYTLHLDYDRQILEDNSNVIKEYLYKDNFKVRMDFDISRRLKFGTDYIMAFYSDSNILYEPGVDLLYYMNFEPKMFYFKYRYFYKDFKYNNKEYWTPNSLSTNIFTLNWRHFLNKEEIFFGADDIYYDLRYDFSIDSERVTGHKFTCKFNWDINKRLNFNITGSVMGSSNSVYEEEQFCIGFKYYF